MVASTVILTAILLFMNLICMRTPPPPMFTLAGGDDGGRTGLYPTHIRANPAGGFFHMCFPLWNRWEWTADASQVDLRRCRICVPGLFSLHHASSKAMFCTISHDKRTDLLLSQCSPVYSACSVYSLISRMFFSWLPFSSVPRSQWPIY